jgi:hypothetical protein
MRLIKFVILSLSLTAQSIALANHEDPFGHCETVVITPPSLSEPLAQWFDRVRNHAGLGYIPDTYYELFMVCDKSPAVCMYELNGNPRIDCGELDPAYDTTIQTLTTALSINQICNTLKVGNAKHAGSSYLLCPYALGRK